MRRLVSERMPSWPCGLLDLVRLICDVLDHERRQSRKPRAQHRPPRVAKHVGRATRRHSGNRRLASQYWIQPQESMLMPTVESGKKAPAFSLKDQDGKIHRLQDYAGRPLVLYFYPKDDTPGCTKEACAFRDNLPKFAATKAAVLGVSILDE